VLKTNLRQDGREESSLALGLKKLEGEGLSTVRWKEKGKDATLIGLEEEK